jgi:hypothetical protein
MFAAKEFRVGDQRGVIRTSDACCQNTRGKWCHGMAYVPEALPSNKGRRAAHAACDPKKLTARQSKTPARSRR